MKLAEPFFELLVVFECQEAVDHSKQGLQCTDGVDHGRRPVKVLLDLL